MKRSVLAKTARRAAAFALAALLALLCGCGAASSGSTPAQSASSGASAASKAAGQMEENYNDTVDQIAETIALTDETAALAYRNAVALLNGLNAGDQQAVDRCFAKNGQPVYDVGVYALADISGLELGQTAIAWAQTDEGCQITLRLEVIEPGNAPLLPGTHDYHLTYHTGQDSFYDSGCIWRMYPETELSRQGAEGLDEAGLAKLLEEVDRVRHWFYQGPFESPEEVHEAAQLVYTLVRMGAEGKTDGEGWATLDEISGAAERYLGLKNWQPSAQTLEELCYEQEGRYRILEMGSLVEGPEPPYQYTSVRRNGQDYQVTVWYCSDAQGLVPEYGYEYTMNNTENPDAPGK